MNNKKRVALKDVVQAINKLNRDVQKLHSRIEALRKRVEEGPTNSNRKLW